VAISRMRYIISRQASSYKVPTCLCSCLPRCLLLDYHHRTSLIQQEVNRAEMNLAKTHLPELESELEVSLGWHERGQGNKYGHCTHNASVAAFSSLHSSRIFCSVGPLYSAPSSMETMPVTAFLRALAAFVWDLSFKKEWIKV
jgi:hypothetical protein